MREITISSSRRVEFIDITSKVRKIVEEEEVREGICLIYCPHTTAGLTINENALIPSGAGYSHIEGNADAHIKSSIIGNSVELIISNGNLILGTWQGIFFCEFDGPRTRRVWIKIK